MAELPKKRIAAVIVTYNRATLLQECVNGVRGQSWSPDEIIVVNNGSTDGTAKWLEAQTDLMVIHQPNTGSAGGFSSGIRMAYERGHDWIWCMDDDGIPAPDCLDKLLKVGGLGFHYVAPNLLDDNDKSHFDLRFRSARTRIVGFCGGPFNAILLSRDLVQAIGYPIKEFFIWGDEVEYCNRIVESGFPVVTVRDAIHHHKSTAIDFRTCKRGFYLVRNRVYCYRLFRDVYRSRTVYLMGVLMQTGWFILSCVRHMNWDQIYEALAGFVCGWLDPLHPAQEQACWWGISVVAHDLSGEDLNQKQRS